MSPTIRSTWVEFKRQIIFVQTYPFQEISGLVVLYIFFIGMYWSRSVASSQEQITYLSSKHLLLGYLLWTYAVSAISLLAFDIAEEAKSGTLEQLALIPHQLRPWIVRCLGNFILQTGRASILLLLIIITTNVRPSALTIFQAGTLVLTVVGLYGMGLVVGAVTLICKKTTFFVNIIHFFLFFFTGLATPIDSFPSGLFSIAQFIPLTHGIAILRFPPTSASTYHAAQQTIVWLCITTALWIVIGIAALSSAYKLARVRGLFNKF